MRQGSRSPKALVPNGLGLALTGHYYSNLDHATGYVQHSFDLSAYIGQAISLKYTGSEDASLKTSFVIDDAAIDVS